jgi:RNAse (barnase) inhibitor barstar
MEKSQIFKYFQSNSEIPKAGDDTVVGILPKGISDVKALFDGLYNVLSLPGYFGFNWNALLDCLRDFHWLTEKTIILVHEEIPQLPKDDLWEYLDVLFECINGCKENEDHELIVMFPEHSKDQINRILSQ